MNEHFANSPAWKGVAAVREGRVVYLPQEYFLVNAGPFYGDAIAYIAQCVYPEIYGESKE
ncbi:MAG TPA: ABC transporter substrate-binding protein, partial [Clostridia bacterium]|nr:ABC transporter substrate-binding protein [Clostridia bacterium]